jgi:multiple sugar transport system permease protein
VTPRRHGWAPYALLLPSLAFLALFFASPMVQSFGLALQDADGHWSLASIEAMVGDARFREALLTTLVLLGVLLPLQFALALAMALVVNARLKGAKLWLYIYALPLGISELSAGIIWFAIFTQQGWLNSLLEGVGLIDRQVIWLDFNREWLLILAVVAAEAWRATAIMMIILVAGLQGIDRAYLEAAEVYGASPWQRLRRVILPLLTPAIAIAAAIRFIDGFRVFDHIYVLTGGGPGTLTTSASIHVYKSFFQTDELGRAVAEAMLLFLASLLLVLLATRLTLKGSRP